MYTLKINKEKFNIPQSWDELTLKQYLRLSEFVRLNEIDKDEDVDPIFFYNRIFKCLTDKSVNLNDADYDDVIKFAEVLAFIQTPFKASESTIIDTKNAYIRPRNYENLTFGEFADLQTFANNPTIDSQLKMFAAIVDVYEKPNYLKLKFLPKLKKFNNNEKLDYVSSLPATQLSSIQAFFLRGQKMYMRNMVLSLEIQALRLNMKGISLLVSAGMSRLWKRVKMTLPRWTKSS
jgi:hypothetical protein